MLSATPWYSVLWKSQFSQVTCSHPKTVISSSSTIAPPYAQKPTGVSMNCMSSTYLERENRSADPVVENDIPAPLRKGKSTDKIISSSSSSSSSERSFTIEYACSSVSIVTWAYWCVFASVILMQLLRLIISFWCHITIITFIRALSANLWNCRSTELRIVGASYL